VLATLLAADHRKDLPRRSPLMSHLRANANRIARCIIFDSYFKNVGSSLKNGDGEEAPLVMAYSLEKGTLVASLESSSPENM